MDNPVGGWLNNYQISKKGAENVDLLDKVQFSTFKCQADQENRQKEAALRDSVLEIMTKVDDGLDFLIEKLKEDAEYISVFLKQSNYTLNMKNPIVLNKSAKLKSQGKNEISHLNTFYHKGVPKNSISAIAVTFNKNASLGLASGLKFFSDSKGVNLIHHVFAGTSVHLTNIAPIVFKRPEIYYTYYFNSEGLSPYLQAQHSDLPCVVYGIPKAWTHVCWLLDSISSEIVRLKDAKMIPKLSELLRISTDLMRNIVGPCVLKELCNHLVIRLTIKLRNLLMGADGGNCEYSSEERLLEIFGITKDEIEGIIKNAIT